MIDVEADQALPVPFVERRGGDHPDPHPQAHIVLDDVAVGGRQHDAGAEAMASERLVHLGAAGETEHIGDEGIPGQIRHGQRLAVQQRMAVGHHHAAPPAIAGHGRQLVEQVHGLGGDGHLHIPVLRHLRQLGRGSLMQLDAHLGVAAGEFGNDRRQLVAGHGVGGGDAQHPAGGQLIPEGKLTNLLHLGHHSPGQLHHLLPHGGQARQVLALAGKQRQPQLLFQHLHLLAEGRLGGIELLRRRRDVEVVLHYLGEVLEPGDVHQGARRSMCQPSPSRV